MRGRDERGRFLPGNTAARGGGRPRSEDADKLAASLSRCSANGTLSQWEAAFKRKLAKADPWATEFLWNRLVGKVPDKQEVTGAEGEPVEIIVRYVTVPVPDFTAPDAGAAAG
jgi:hypothetical protein